MRRSGFFILAFLAVITGYLIYVGWRDVVPFWGFIHHNRQLWLFLRQSLGGNILLPEWMVYSLPQGLWSFGLVMFVSGIWIGESWKFGYIWLAACLLIVVLWEVFQSLGFISGTFCWMDTIVSLCGVGLGIFLFTLKNLNHESTFN